MRGVFIFIALFLCLGLAWLFLSSNAQDNKEYEARLVGALNFLETLIPETSPNIQRVVLHAPSIESRTEPDHWSLTGVFAAKDDAGRTEYGQFMADLEVACRSYSRRECWKLVRLQLDNDMRSGAELPPGRPPDAQDPGEVAVEMSERRPLAIERAPPSEGGEAVTTVSSEESEPAASSETASGPRETLSPRAQDNGVKEPAGRVGEEPGPETIKRIQEALKRIGYDPGPTDGMLGPLTATAIQAYRRQHGLGPSGRPTMELLKLLEKDLQGSSAKSLSHVQLGG